MTSDLQGALYCPLLPTLRRRYNVRTRCSQPQSETQENSRTSHSSTRVSSLPTVSMSFEQYSQGEREGEGEKHAAGLRSYSKLAGWGGRVS